jgi:hypothetical protein
MIEYSEIKVGDRLRIVGAGAPGTYALGQIVTVTKIEPNEVWTKDSSNVTASFFNHCGAARLEKVKAPTSNAWNTGAPNKEDIVGCMVALVTQTGVHYRITDFTESDYEFYFVTYPCKKYFVIHIPPEG